MGNFIVNFSNSVALTKNKFNNYMGKISLRYTNLKEKREMLKTNIYVEIT